jgi:hypothetical protein
MLNPSGTGGAYNKVTLTAGKKYRLRLINTSVDNHFRVSLDNHGNPSRLRSNASLPRGVDLPWDWRAIRRHHRYQPGCR